MCSVVFLFAGGGVRKCGMGRREGRERQSGTTNGQTKQSTVIDEQIPTFYWLKIQIGSTGSNGVCTPTRLQTKNASVLKENISANENKQCHTPTAKNVISTQQQRRRRRREQQHKYCPNINIMTNTQQQPRHNHTKQQTAAANTTTTYLQQ